MADDKYHSTGRGGWSLSSFVPHNPSSNNFAGAGNIGPGEGIYVDSEIVREGPLGESGRPNQEEYSAGRGGAGNMVPSPRNGSPVPSQDVIPETATKEKYDNFHTGRGGQGNVHKDKYDGHSKPPKSERRESFVEKAKHAVGLDGKKHHEESPLKNESA